MARRWRVLMAVTLVLGALWLWAPPAAAQTAPREVPVVGGQKPFCRGQIGGFLGMPTWYKYLNPRIEPVGPDGANTCVIDFTFSAAAIGGILLAVFEILLRIAGIVAIVFVIWGGVKMQTSLGNPEQLAGARTTLINALVGLVIVISATAIVNFIGHNIIR